MVADRRKGASGERCSRGRGPDRCAGDDRWLALTIATDEQWRALVGAMDDDELDAWRDADGAARRAHHDEIDAAIARWTARRDDASAAAALQALGIPACPAFTTGDLVGDAHLAARGFMVEWDQVDVGPARFPGYPLHFERRGFEVVGAPGLGADNAAVLAELGYSDDDTAALRSAGVIADQPPG